ncbi:signal peptidase I [Nocardioides caldifontis]|uniref:signal peptidase I n=1 Tax=Nocardioides caldifontis TaxID=2588938 RepID=UPI001EF02728|nr:signal peptidase I [Nocardioides caldifontis]
MSQPDDREEPLGGEDPGGERPLRPWQEPEQSKKRHLSFWQELALLLGVALVLAVGIKALFLQAFYIPSGSMNDTLVFNDRILVQKVSYWGSAGPERGDIVVFADPGGWLDDSDAPSPDNVVSKTLEVFGLFPSGGHLVKRVIGVGGDTVACCDRRGRVTVNGTPLDERGYLAAGERPSERTFEQEVPEGYLWVMGDNRSQSADSRFHLGDPGGGFVPEENVVGKVFSVVWPLGHAKMLNRPETFEAVEAP